MPLNRQLARLLVTPPARAAIRMCLLCLVCVRTLATRLLTRLWAGPMMTLGLTSLAGWTIRLMMLLFISSNLQGLGAVDRQTARLTWLMNLL